jgi:hypothetical protein
MLADALGQIGGDAGVEHAMRFVRDDVDPPAGHRAKVRQESADGQSSSSRRRPGPQDEKSEAPMERSIDGSAYSS